MVIKPATLEDLPHLNQHLRLWGPPDYHERQIRGQADGGRLWLIAWRDGRPVGHLALNWAGASRPEIRAYVRDCPHLSAIGVQETLRSQGIGRALIEAAERRVLEQGYPRVGLGVSIDNIRARALYERLGYQDWGHGLYMIQWDSYDEQGNKEPVEERCIYLVKELP
jgi:GNAT superfamily N-acetyltransferase